jgi:hypothetical protein
MLLHVLSFSETKQTHSLDGSSVLPFDLLKAELFYPSRKENVATNETVQKMAVEMAICFSTELRDPKRLLPINSPAQRVNSVGGILLRQITTH